MSLGRGDQVDDGRQTFCLIDASGCVRLARQYALLFGHHFIICSELAWDHDHLSKLHSLCV